MANLNNVGEMSLSQLEQNIEANFGKKSTNDLLQVLNTTKLDKDTAPIFYASLYRALTAANSTTILQNPTSLTNFVQKVENNVIEFQQAKQQKIEELKLHQQHQQNRLENLENLSLENLKNYTIEQRTQIFMRFATILNFDEKDQNYVVQKFNKHIVDPKDKNNNVSTAVLFGLKDIHDLDCFMQTLWLFARTEQHGNFRTPKDVANFLETRVRNETTEKQKEMLDIIVNSDPEERKKNILIAKKIDELQQQGKVNLEKLSPEKTNEFILFIRNQLNSKTQDIDFSDMELEGTLQNIMESIEDPAKDQPIYIQSEDFEKQENVINMTDDFASFDSQVDNSFATIRPNSIYQEITNPKDSTLHKPSEAEKTQTEPMSENKEQQDTYIMEVPAKKNLFENIRNGISNLFKRFTQKALPDPTATKAKHTNMSLEDYDRKSSIMSTIRSIGDKITNVTKSITTLGRTNKEPVKNAATVISTSSKEEINETPNATDKKITTQQKTEQEKKSKPFSPFDQWKVNNEGNRLEHNAMSKMEAKDKRARTSITIGQPNSSDNRTNKNDEKSNDDELIQ